MTDCKHPNEEHCADNGPTSGGCIYWCPDCGALSITSFRSEREWQLPKVLTEEAVAE